MGTERDQLKKKQKGEYTTRKYLDLVPGTSFHTWYCCCIFERKHSAAQNNTEAQGKARHRTAPHGAALRC